MICKYNLFFVILIANIIGNLNCSKDWSEDENPVKWNKNAKDKIDKMLKRDINKKIAKNLILFLGDGMGPSTVTAGRILKGQKKGNNGEEEITFIESLDHVALSKTYNINAQTADSAGTGTAYLTGVKTRIGSLGLSGKAVDCPTSLNAKLDSILKWAHFAGKKTGIVTTSRITDATPAASYAHVPFREWEAYDDKNFGETQKKQGCKDIAAQLVEDNSFINLIFGGGRKQFLTKNDTDYLDPTNKGIRTDNRNLIEEWKTKMNTRFSKSKFLWNLTEFELLKPKQYDHILGLFSFSDMTFELDKDPNVEPDLISMTKKAIEILDTDSNGFFLLVEGANIDKAHHLSQAKKSLNEFVIFDDTIGESLKMLQDDTLIVATADHSHVFTLGGYAFRGNDLFGLNLNQWTNLSDANLTFTPITYANGPGGLMEIRDFNLTYEMTNNNSYVQESVIYLTQETHGGEDVAIYAHGPMAYLFDGTVEQSYIAHVMAYSACIGPYNKTNNPDCFKSRGILSSLSSTNYSPRSVYVLLIIAIFNIKLLF